MLQRKLLALILFFPLALFAKDHIIVFDAGSSGTRLYLFDVEGPQATPVITEALNVKVKPGLTDETLWSNPEVLHTYIQNLFASANTALSPEERAQTPIYLYATAGMRILPIEDQAYMMQEVRKHIIDISTEHGYEAIQNPDDNIRVVDSSEEGLFIWIAGNYQHGIFERPRFLSPRNTYASLEMGGASAEIAYFGLGAKKHTVPFRFGQYTFPIYSVGEDGYGINEGISLMMNANPSNLASCFPKGSTYPLNNPVLEGQGDFDTCLKTIEKEILYTQAYDDCVRENGKQCSLLGTYQPTNIKPTKYLLTSGFYYTFKALGLADKTLHKPELALAATQFCGMPWDKMKETYPDNPEYLIGYCFNAAWFDTLMTAWNVDDKAALQAIEKYEGKDITWPLGAAYHHVTQ